MLNLGDVLELIYDGFRDSSFAQHQGIIQGSDQFCFHVSSKFGYQVYASEKQDIENFFVYDVSFVAKEFTVNLLHEPLTLEYCIVVYIPGGDLEVYDLPLIVVYQV